MLSKFRFWSSKMGYTLWQHPSLLQLSGLLYHSCNKMIYLQILRNRCHKDNCFLGISISKSNSIEVAIKIFFDLVTFDRPTWPRYPSTWHPCPKSSLSVCLFTCIVTDTHTQTMWKLLQPTVRKRNYLTKMLPTWRYFYDGSFTNISIQNIANNCLLFEKTCCHWRKFVK